MSATTHLLAFAAARHALPPDVRAAALRLLDDTLAVGVAGSTAPGAEGVLATARRMGTAPAEARLLGRAERLPAPAAAFVNGFQIHCLEWDAVHEGAVVHALSVVTAALLAVIDRRGGCEPEAALAALAVGVDIACVLGLAATSPLTFFRPATAGLIGAALACARIDGLAPDRFADVLGLAYSQCAGTMQAHVEGSVALPLQIGLAARAAVTAVDLAAAKLGGPHDALEGPFGYFRVFEEGALDPWVSDLGRVWRIAEVSTKPWPCGRASHATLAALDRLADIEALTAHVPPLVTRLVGRPWLSDMAPAYARLCLPFLVALMARDGRIDPRRFTPQAFADPALRAVGERIRVQTDANPDPNALSPQRMVVRAGGCTREIGMPHTLGSPANPMTPGQTGAKLTLALDLAAEPTAIADPLACLAGARA